MDLVQPLIPDAQKNKSPEIMLEGLRTGLAAFAQFAQIRRNSEMETLRLAQNERIAQDQHAIEREKIYKDAEVQDAMMQSHAKMYDAYSDLAATKAKAIADGTFTDAQRKIAFNKQHEALVNEVNKAADDLKLNDPHFATKEPVQFAANVLQFEDMYRFSPAPEVKNAIRQYRTIADQQKIPLKTGVVNEDGAIKGTGEGRQVPIWQVVKRMQDPLTQEQTMLDLQASGHMQVVHGFRDMTDKAGNKIQVPTTTTEPNPLIKSFLEKGKGVDFSPVPSRVPPTMLPKSAASGTSPTELPAPDVPADTTVVDYPPEASYQPTETDMLLQRAQAAIQKGAPIKAVAERLQSMGIDPNQLWAT